MFNALPNILQYIIPTIIVSLVNMIVPAILSKLTDCEEWDYASSKLKQEVWKIYFASIMNNVIFVLIQMEASSGMAWIFNDSIASFKTANKSGVNYECREDMVAVNFI